jgi:hypothetical protein
MIDLIIVLYVHNIELFMLAAQALASRFRTPAAMDDTLSESLRRVESLIAGHDAVASLAPLTGDVASLRRSALDGSLSSSERRAAFAALAERLQGEREFSEIVLRLFDDTDLDVVRDAIHAAPPFDPRVMGRLRDLSEDDRPEVWQAAASSLARKKDHASLPKMLSWARTGDAAHRRAGLSAVAFLLIPEQHLAVVEAICEDGPRDDEDEAILVEALRVAESRVAFWRRATQCRDSDSQSAG